MNLNQEQINQLASAVAARLSSGMVLKTGTGLPTQQPRPATQSQPTGNGTAFATLDQAVEAARASQPRWVALPMERRKQIIAKLRETLLKHVEELSRLAV